MSNSRKIQKAIGASLSSATATPDSVVAPIPQAVTAVSASVTLAEIALLFGQNRTLIDPATNMPTGFQRVDWLAAYSLNPAIAVALHAALTSAIGQYERSYGTIPTDPTNKIVEKDGRSQ